MVRSPLLVLEESVPLPCRGLVLLLLARLHASRVGIAIPSYERFVQPSDRTLDCSRFDRVNPDQRPGALSAWTACAGDSSIGLSPPDFV